MYGRPQIRKSPQNRVLGASRGQIRETSIAHQYRAALEQTFEMLAEPNGKTTYNRSALGVRAHVVITPTSSLPLAANATASRVRAVRGRTLHRQIAFGISRHPLDLQSRIRSARHRP